MQAIAVVGATGNQGGSVVDSFLLQRPRMKILGLTRNPSSPASRALVAKGVQVVKADTGSVPSLVRAFTGANIIFAVTDYWSPFWDEDAISKLPKGKSIREFAYEEEIRHGKNMADAAAKVLEEGKLDHYVWSCTSSPREWSKGKYSSIFHFESKAAVTKYIREKLPKLAAKMSVIHVSFYTSNVYTFKSMQPQKQSDGTYTIDRLCPGSKMHPFINTRNETGPLVSALISKAPGKTLLAYTAMVSFDMMAAMVSRGTGIDCRFRQVTLDQLREEFPEEGEEGTMSDMYSTDFGYSGGDPSVIEPRDLGFEDRPGDVEEWLRVQDWSGILR